MSAKDVYIVGPKAAEVAEAMAPCDSTWALTAFDTLPVLEASNPPGAIVLMHDRTGDAEHAVLPIATFCRPSVLKFSNVADSVEPFAALIEAVEKDWICQSLAQFDELAGPDFVAEMLDLFRDQSVKYIADLNAAIENGCSSTTRRVIHTLKSSLGNFGARRLKDLAQLMENDAARGDLDAVRKNVSSLVQGLQKFQTMLPVLEQANK